MMDRLSVNKVYMDKEEMKERGGREEEEEEEKEDSRLTVEECRWTHR